MTDAAPRKDVPDAPEAGGGDAPADDPSETPRSAAATAPSAEPSTPAPPVLPAAPVPVVPEAVPEPSAASVSALAAAVLAQSEQRTGQSAQEVHGTLSQEAQSPQAGSQDAPPVPADQAPTDQTPANDAPSDRPADPAAKPAVTWSANQPAPAPWFLGRPGQVPPPGWSAGPPPQNLPPNGSARPPYQQPGAQPGPPPNGRPGPWPGQQPGPQSGDPSRQQPNRPPDLPPGRRPDPRPPREPVRPGEQPKRPPLSLKSRWARGLAMGGAICTLLAVLYGYESFPTWMIGAGAGLCLAVAGLWVGAFAQRDASRQGRRAPDAIASIVWCVISAVISLGILAYSVALYPQLQQYSRCMQSSNTVSEQNACLQQLQDNWPFGNRAGKPAGL